MTDDREQLVAYYRALRRNGLNDSHSGNASIRIEQKVWVTPRGAPAERLTEAELVACQLPETIGENASLDARLHLAVYRENPDVGAVLHAHSPYTITLTLAGRPFTPVDHEGRHYFPEVPVISLATDHYWERHQQEAPERVARVLANNRVCVLGAHGVYARGRNLDEAYKWLCSLEHSGRIAFLAMLSSK